MECGDYEGRPVGATRGRKPARPVVLPPPAARDPARYPPPDVPLSDMDEISYWIHTKRAPCLMNYDNIIKKQNEEVRCVKADAKAPIEPEPSPPKKKKKRKLSLLDDDSLSSEKRQNVYFEASQKHNESQRQLNNCKSDSMGSDLDFNIKNTSIGEKPKRLRLQKNNRSKIHKKNKVVVTSTPKTTINLRRSLRQAQLNHSLDIFNTTGTNGAVVKHVVSSDEKLERANKVENLAGGDQTTATNKRHTSHRNKSKNASQQNGQYEDYSDVSGFTANYIRSTKVQSSKTPRKLRCKTKNIVKESQQSPQNDGNMIVCLNKSMNTGLPEPNMLNCSTDSSQNVINLVTSKNNTNTIKLDKSTSLLKFIDTRAKSRERASASKDKQKGRTNLNVSFQSQSSGTSRYPKRHRSHRVTGNVEPHQMNTRRGSTKNCIEFNNSDKKENPDEIVTRMRSGCDAAQQRENSVLVVSNSTEQVSSMVSMNVASPPLAKQRKKRRPARQARAKKPSNKSGMKDSLRDKSGFTACFSESEDDSVPLIQRKYFCN